MSIDTTIAALIAALDRNTAALTAAGTGAAVPAAADKPKADKPKAEKKDEPKITQDQVNAALIKLKDDFGMEHAKEIIKSAGKAEKMAEIKPAQYQAVHDAAVAKHAELTSGAGGSNDDDGGI